MKFFIPKLGDQIVLTEPWRFPLYAESRNSALAKYYNKDLVLSRTIWTKLENVPLMRDIAYPRINSHDFYSRKPDGSINYGVFDRKGYNAATEAAKGLYQYQLASFGKPTLDVEFPIGTVLSIERIYIRKGQTAFDSISFYVKNLEGSGKAKKPKAIRFWAKLDDCDGIEFEKVEVKK